MSEDTGDLELTMEGSSTKKMRAIQRSVEKERLKDQYRDKEVERLAGKISELTKVVEDLNIRLVKTEGAIAMMKWLGTTIGGAMLAGLGTALLKLFG